MRTSGNDSFKVLRGGGSYHARGWAIDINYGSNPWVGGQAASSGTSAAAQNSTNDEAIAIIWRAVWLTGHGEVYYPREMRERGEHQTTEQIWAHAAAANAAFHDYLSAHADTPDNLSRITGWITGGRGVEPLASRRQPARPPHSHANHDDPTSSFTADLHTDLQSATAALWRQQIASDYATYRAVGGNFIMSPSTPRTSLTLTDHHLELVRALRDAGGLAWGASDIEGEQAGDFMHFDTRTIQACHAYMAHRHHA